MKQEDKVLPVSNEHFTCERQVNQIRPDSKYATKEIKQGDVTEYWDRLLLIR